MKRKNPMVWKCTYFSSRIMIKMSSIPTLLFTFCLYSKNSTTYLRGASSYKNTWVVDVYYYWVLGTYLLKIGQYDDWSNLSPDQSAFCLKINDHQFSRPLYFLLLKESTTIEPFIVLFAPKLLLPQGTSKAALIGRAAEEGCSRLFSLWL